MPRKTWIIVLAILILGGALGGGLYWRWVNSPRYALQHAALALEARDMPKFFSYLDLKEIFSNFIADSSKNVNKPEDSQADDWSKYSRQLGRKFAYLFMPKFFDAFEPQIRNLIKHYLVNLKQSQILGIAAAVTVARIDTRGNEAQVTMTDPKTQETLRFAMRRQPNHGVWQIVSVNYQDLKRFYKREFES